MTVDKSCSLDQEVDMPMRQRFSILAWSLVLGIVACLADHAVQAEEPFIVVASTTSTEDSGFFDCILPRYKKESGVDVRVVAVGTGDAIELAQRGYADVLLVHHKPSEQAFVAEGHGVKRCAGMWNDFIIVGPQSDAA